MTTLTMYDSTSPSSIPSNAQVVGGYINGAYGPGDSAGWNNLASWQQFPNALWNPIWVFIPNGNHCSQGNAEGVLAGNYAKNTLLLPAGSTVTLDVEAGDASFANFCGYPAAWAAGVRSVGMSPTGYTSRSTVGTAYGGFPGVMDDIWAADVINCGVCTAHSVAGAAATQYAEPGIPGCFCPTPGNVDISLCNTGWPRRPGSPGQPPPPPPPPPPPAPQVQENKWLNWSCADQKYHLVTIDNNHFVHHYTDASVTNLQNQTPQFTDNLNAPAGEPAWELLTAMTTNDCLTFVILIRTIHNQIWANTLTFGSSWSGWIQWNNSYNIGP